MAAASAAAPAAAGRDSLFGILDQLVVSATRFAAAWVLARFTSADNYGAYATAFAALLVVEILQAGLVTWPLTVLGAARRGAGFRTYVSGALALQGALGVLCALALMVTAALVRARGGSSTLALALLAAAAASFCMQAQELCRRVFLTALRARVALAIDAVGAAVQLLALGLLLHRRTESPDALSAWHALLAVAGSAALAAVVALAAMKDLRGGSGWTLRATLAENWSFGRWILASRLGEGALNHALTLVVTALAGAAVAASLEAPRLLLAPLQVTSFGIINLLLPRGAAALEREGLRGLSAEVHHALVTWGPLFAGYAVVMCAFPDLWLRLAFGGRYQDRRLIWAWAAAHLLLGIRVILGATVYVLRRSDLMMTATLVAGSLALAGAVLLTPAWGPLGAATARLLGEAVLLAAVVWAGRRAAAGTLAGAR